MISDALQASALEASRPITMNLLHGSWAGPNYRFYRILRRAFLRTKWHQASITRQLVAQSTEGDINRGYQPTRKLNIDGVEKLKHSIWW